MVTTRLPLGEIWLGSWLISLVVQVIGAALCLDLLLALSSPQPSPLLRLSLAASLAAAPGVVLLLHLEQGHSDLAALYLSAAVLCDLAALTVPSSARVDRPPPARCFLHGLLLALESRPPRCGSWRGGRLSPEDESGVLGRLFFAWINPVLVRGYRGLLRGDGLPSLGTGMGAKGAREGMVEAWEGRGEYLPPCLPACRGWCARKRGWGWLAD